MPVATGMALAEREQDTGAVTTVFLGDGTLGQGAVYECMNMASMWSLPLLVVLENNFYAQSTPSHLTVAGSIPERAEAFGIEARQLDTTDVEQIAEAARAATRAVREQERPFFLVLDTYRFSPHSKGDDNRDEAEIEARRAFDPLTVCAARLAGDERRAIEEACEERVAAELEAAEMSAPAGALA